MVFLESEFSKLYCIVSGSKLANDKIEFLLVQSGPIPHWIPKEWKQINHREIMRYLGIPFGIGVSLSNMWRWYLDRVRNKLHNWGNKFLSLAGKIQVANKIFLATHVYFSSCWMPSKKGYEDLVKIIRQFLWAKWDGTRGFISTSWAHCIQPKNKGGLGLIDPRTQGFCLASKWIIRATNGNEPWKILIRNRIDLATMKCKWQ